MRRLRKAKLLAFLRELNRTEKVYCPQWMDNGDLMLMPLGEGEFRGDFGKTTLSPKGILFPQREGIMRFRGNHISKITDSTRTIIFGLRPCEMKAIRFTDRFMTRDNLVDPHYMARRKGITTLVVACHEPPSDTCFCSDAGAMPYLETGYDLQMFDAGDYYLSIAGSGKGREFLSNESFEPTAQQDEEKLEKIKAAALRSQENRPGVRKAAEILRGDRVDDGFWERLAQRCINCGSCVYVCPTCTCFNVFELPSEEGFTRYRTWDACLHAGFTRETSGHNPRPTEGSRLARRHEHKFKFDLINYDEFGCVGCGRCSDACPVGLGAIEIVREINQL